MLVICKITAAYSHLVRLAHHQQEDYDRLVVQTHCRPHWHLQCYRCSCWLPTYRRYCFPPLPHFRQLHRPLHRSAYSHHRYKTVAFLSWVGYHRCHLELKNNSHFHPFPGQWHHTAYRHLLPVCHSAHSSTWPNHLVPQHQRKAFRHFHPALPNQPPAAWSIQQRVMVK